MRAKVASLGIAAAAWVLQAVLLAQLVARRAEMPDRLLVPPAGLVEKVATGYGNLLADVVWAQALVYNGDQLTRPWSARDPSGLYPAFDLVTTLDPRFLDAALYGSWALGDAGRTDEAVRLLEKAMARWPGRWQYPYQLGFIEFLYGRNYLAAARHFLQAASLPGCPPSAPRLAASMYARGHQKELAIETWRAVYARADDYLKGVARRALAKLGSPISD